MDGYIGLSWVVPGMSSVFDMTSVEFYSPCLQTLQDG